MTTCLTHCLCHPEKPALELGDLPLYGGQARIEEPSYSAILVSPLQPRCRGVSGVFISVPTFSFEPSHPKDWVDLRDDRFALWKIPAVERPEGDWPLAPVSQVEEPRQTGEGGLGDRTLNIKEEDRLGCRRPPFRQPEPIFLAHPP